MEWEAKYKEGKNWKYVLKIMYEKQKQKQKKHSKFLLMLQSSVE